MKLHIIIPNYNGCHFLSKCLDSLRRQTYRNFYITVVDNRSTDQSLTFLREQYPEVQILEQSHNLGFAAAANIAIQSSVSPYVMLLNNDTILAPDCIYHMMHVAQKNPRAFSVGAHILTMQKPHRTDTTGDFYSIYGYAFCRDQGFPARTLSCRQVFTNCGCAVIYRRSLLHLTGLFHPDYFAYLEDVDLGFRARRLGFQNLFCREAIVYHVGSGTTGEKYTPFKVYHSARNNVWLQRENLTPLQLILHAPFTLIGTALKYFYFRRLHLHTIYRKGLLDGWKTHRISHALGIRSFLRTEPWILYGTFLYTVQYIRRKLFLRSN